MNKKQIKDLALSNGFKLKEQPSGEMDLNPYVYDFADALLAKANERVEELELVIVAITHADETGYIDDVGFVQGWSEVCDETKVLMNKFAIENQIKGAKFYGDKLNELGFDSVGEFTDKVCEQLRREQE